MSHNRRIDKVMTKTEKIKELQSSKLEDVEFSSIEADLEDIEALNRSAAADRRQSKELHDFRFKLK